MMPDTVVTDTHTDTLTDLTVGVVQYNPGCMLHLRSHFLHLRREEGEGMKSGGTLYFPQHVQYITFFS